MDNFVIIVAFLLIGIALRRVPLFPDQTGNALNLVVIHVSLPALILLNVPRLDISSELLVPAIMPWAILVLSAGFVLFVSRLLAWTRETTGCLLLLVPLGNTSFLGIPMVRAFFGERGIPYALLYDQLGTFLALATYGSVVLALYGSGEGRPTLARVAKKVVTFPPLIALVVAFISKSLPNIPIADNLFSMLSSTLVPLVMIAVGFQLKLRLGREQAGLLAFGLTAKMVVAPLAALLVCGWAGLEGDAARVSVFEAGMPPMVSAGALAIMGNLSPSLTAALIAVGIVVSFVTLPILHQLIVR
jgi:predicted permease